MPSFWSAQNYQEEIANHSSQVLEVAGGGFLHIWIPEWLIKESESKKGFWETIYSKPIISKADAPLSTPP